MLEMREVPGCPGYYVTNTGRVWSTRAHRGSRGRWLKLTNHNRGYPSVRIQNKTRLLHSVVAEAFHGPRPVGLEVRHLNGNPLDNRASNLKWGTRSSNTLDQVRHGTHNQASKTECPQGHPYTDERRACFVCKRKRERAAYHSRVATPTS